MTKQTHGEIFYRAWHQGIPEPYYDVPQKEQDAFERGAKALIHTYEEEKAAERVHLYQPGNPNDTLCGQKGRSETFHEITRGAITCGECMFIYQMQQENEGELNIRRRAIGDLWAWIHALAKTPKSNTTNLILCERVDNIIRDMNPAHPLIPVLDGIKRQSVLIVQSDLDITTQTESVEELKKLGQIVRKHPKRVIWESPHRAETSFGIWHTNSVISQLKGLVPKILDRPHDPALQEQGVRIITQLEGLMEPGDYGFDKLPLIRQAITIMNLENPEWRTTLETSVDTIKPKGIL